MNRATSGVPLIRGCNDVECSLKAAIDCYIEARRQATGNPDPFWHPKVIESFARLREACEQFLQQPPPKEKKA